MITDDASIAVAFERLDDIGKRVEEVESFGPLHERLDAIERRLNIDLSADRCGGCERQVPPNAASCPHCGIEFVGMVGRVEPTTTDGGGGNG